MSPVDSDPPSRRRALLLLGVALLAVAAVFVRSLQGGFVYDDHRTVQDNPALASVPDMAASLLHPTWEQSGQADAPRSGWWRPLSNVALFTGRVLGGGRPTGFHAVSLALHLLATWAAFRLARRISGDDAIAFFAALLFGLHPVHVEAVAWISAVHEPLAGLFALLSLDSFLAWRQRGSPGSPWPAGALFLCAFLSHELAVAVIPMAIAVDIGLRSSQQLMPEAKRAYVPLLAALAIGYLARVVVFKSPGAGFDRTTTEFGVGFARLLLLRVELMGQGLGLLVWPADLRVFHTFVPKTQLAWPAVGVCVAWAALIAVAWKRRAAPALVAALFAPLAILPMLVNVKALGVFPLAEHFLYLAAFGASLLVAIEVWRLLPRGLAIVLLGVASLALGVRSFGRIPVWSNERTLFTTAVAESPRSPYAHRVLGQTLLDEYRRTRDMDALRKAHAEFQTTLDLGLAAQQGDDTIFAVSDDFLQANIGLAWTLIHEAELDPQHDFAPPVEVLRLVLQRYPRSPAAWTALGAAHYRSGHFDEAQQALEQALSIDPGFVEAHGALGQVWMQRGEWAKARAEVEEALRRRPGNLDYMLLLVGAQERSGDDTAAMATILRGLEIAPRDPRLLVMRGNLMAKHGNLDSALAEFDRVLLAAPQSSEAWLAKGKVLSLKNEKSGALHAFQLAAGNDPTSFEAHYGAGMLFLVADGQGVTVAMPYLVRAYAHRRFENGTADAAGRSLRETLSKLPIQSAETYVALGTSDADHGDVDGALEWIERALKIDPSNGPALYLKGGMLKAKGDTQGALSAWKRACEVLPDSVLVFASTGGLLAELGNRDEARTYLQQALEIARKAGAQAREIIPALERQILELGAPPK